MATPQGSNTRKPGVLPMPAQAHAQNQPDATKPTKGRSTAAQDGVKAKVRWLPPALTEEEFFSILGSVWKPGSGKVNWFSYNPGKMPKSASKDPIPAFALLQVKEDDLQQLVVAVQNAVWEDAKGTFNNPSLIGPPYVELSIYKKIPVGKLKKDPKEGTIDEDDEWKTWQFSLTEDPTLKKEQEEDAHPEETAAGESNAKRPMTALVAHILENKANKVKEAANPKSRKHARGDSQSKGKASASTEEPKKKSKDRADKPRETVKILKKQAATEAAAEAAKAVAKDIKAGSASTSERPAGRRQLGLKDILKRDLGIKDTESESKPRRGKAQENGSSAAAATSSSKQASEQAATPTASKAQAEKSSRGSRRRGKESKASDSKGSESKAGGSSEAPAPAPVKPIAILQKKKEEPPATTSTKETAAAAKSAAAAPPTGPKAGNAKGTQAGNSQKKGNASTASAPASGSTRAFLKHANPSQGVTEALLKDAMGAFGSVGAVEIDRRKGFAYVEFADHAGLVKAMAASPVNIANANVQILERKDQGPKKSTAAPSNTTSAGNAKDASSSAPTAPAAPAAPAAAAEKAAGDQQPAAPKRSRRRGRGKGGNGGAGGKEDNKSGDQNGSSGGGASASTPAPSAGETAGAG